MSPRPEDPAPGSAGAVVTSKDHTRARSAGAIVNSSTHTAGEECDGPFWPDDVGLAAAADHAFTATLTNPEPGPQQIASAAASGATSAAEPASFRPELIDTGFPVHGGAHHAVTATVTAGPDTLARLASSIFSRARAFVPERGLTSRINIGDRP
jgi:hypothetical protein